MKKVMSIVGGAAIGNCLVSMVYLINIPQLSNYEIAIAGMMLWTTAAAGLILIDKARTLK